MPDWYPNASSVLYEGSLTSIHVQACLYTDQDFPAFGYRRDTSRSRNHSPVRTETYNLSCKDFLIESHIFWCHLYYTRIIPKAVSCISYISFFYFPCLVESASPQSEKGDDFVLSIPYGSLLHGPVLP